MFIVDGRELVDPRISHKSALQSGVGRGVGSMACGIIDEESMMARRVCHFAGDNPDMVHVISSHRSGRFGKWDRHVSCEFQGHLSRHTCNPFGARERMMGALFRK